LGLPVDFNRITAREIEPQFGTLSTDGPERCRRNILKDMPSIPYPMPADANQSYTDGILLHHALPTIFPL
jgi:hypothetical protein